ncbi:GNAT family N-acetyltransferase [Candidatus Bathyarchaeota archaeon]|nr:GNAT family N-acetyltransferase [Candidatus Bathyarchaeota archaeon]
MSIIRLLKDEDFDDYIDQTLDAYPVMIDSVTPESRRIWKENMIKQQSSGGTPHYYGCFREGKMVGGAMYHDYEMNVHGKIIKVGGIGNVFVNLFVKKEHVAKDLLQNFHKYCREQGAILSTLYPFRPDFYNQMGYGYGKKLNQYKIRPIDLPKGRKNGVTYLNKNDSSQILDCYNKYVKKNHGMILKNELGIERLLRGKLIGYKKNGEIEGLAKIKFEKVIDKNPLLQNMIVTYFIYNTKEAFKSILAFFNSQLDQVDRIIFETPEDDFHFLAKDPRDGDPVMYYDCQETNRQALGIMYRVLNTHKLFQELNDFNFNDVSLKLKLTVLDSFLPENNGSTIIQFINGKPNLSSDLGYDVEVRMKVEWFSSLIMGVISFKKLFTYNLLEISDEKYKETLNKLFYFKEKPVTLEEF